MKPLTKKQIKKVIKWMNKWEATAGTAIPIRFKEDFTVPDEEIKRRKAKQRFKKIENTMTELFAKPSTIETAKKDPMDCTADISGYDVFYIN